LNAEDELWCLHCSHIFKADDLHVVKMGDVELVYCPNCKDGGGIGMDLHRMDSDIAQHHMKLEASRKD